MRISTWRLRASAGLVVLMTALALPGLAAQDRAGASAPVAAEPGAGYLVGRGIADVTGEAAEVGMMGYGDSSQATSGIHQRQRARAFVIADAASGERVVHVVADVGMIFQSVRDAVLARLQEKFGERYAERNVMLTATHTHAGPGGYSHHNLYNLTTMGFHGRTFRALVNGIVSAIELADSDLQPSQLRLSSGHLDNASVNRSRTAFDRNPAADKAHFPDARDTLSTTLQVRRNGRLEGAINWFPVHATSMSTNNTLISPDNKGYAEHHWEHELHGVDHVREPRPDFIASFAQTNAGDMSPNLNLRPTDGPTQDEFANTRIIGERQLDSALGMLDAAKPVKGGVDSRITYVDMANQTVAPEFTPDGQTHRTCTAAMGAAFGTGSTEDGGGGLPFLFKEGKDGGNPLLAAISSALYTASPALKACQAPKEIFIPLGDLDLVQQKLPVQLTRVGDLYLIGIPAEVTVVAGLRLRQTVAEIVGADLDQVLVQGYANAYGHYVTTPEEYDSLEYEGASTLFGRYELPALMQVSARLATAMRDGADVPLGTKERDRSSTQLPSPAGVPIFDAPQLFHAFGDVLTQPRASYRTGEQASAVFAGAHPNNDLHHGGTYLSVERLDGSTWTKVADDGDWSTKFRWARDGLAASKVTITWDVPPGTSPGSYRIRYFGDARGLLGQLQPIRGASRLFEVLP